MKLEAIRIPEPCPASWAAMNGDERSRFCERCTKSVHDLSAMTRSEGERLFEDGAKICIRIRRRADGSVVTKDDAKPVVQLPPQRRWASAMMAAVAVLGFFLAGCVKRQPAPDADAAADKDKGKAEAEYGEEAVVGEPMMLPPHSPYYEPSRVPPKAEQEEETLMMGAPAPMEEPVTLPPGSRKAQ